LIEFLQCLGIFLFEVVLGIGWVASVRSVETRAEVQLVAISMGMQAISYGSTLLLVNNNWTMVTGIIGAGLGALLGLRVPSTWFRKDGPSS
jgi:hypothetical protein